MKHWFSNLRLSKCLICLLMVVVVFQLVFSLFWPKVVIIRKPLVVISGIKGSSSFVCQAAHVAAFELCFEDETYEPQFKGTVKILKGDELLQVLEIARFTIANTYRGAKMVGKKRYRMEYKGKMQLNEILEQGKGYRVELEFSTAIPNAQLLFTCVDFQSTLTKVSMRWKHQSK